MVPKSFVVLCLTAAALLAACGGDDDDDATPTPDPAAAEIEALLTQVVDDFNAGDAAAFSDAFTDRGLGQFFDDETLSREELETIAEDAVGTDEITVMEVRKVEIDGNTATAELLVTIDNTISLESYTFTREANVWLVDGTSLLPPEIPEDVTNIEVEAGDFFFEYDADLITDGSLAFTMENVGEQDHELGLARVTEDFDIDDVLNADPGTEDLPPGVVDVVTGTFAAPGDTATILLAEDLAPGDYAMLCFIPDEETGEPHAALGMHSEFEVP